MKLRWMLAMLPLVFTNVDAGAVVSGPTWVVDPTVPGPDLPNAGASLFDRITLDERGEQQVPFPFERLMARVEAAAGCQAFRPCTRAVLIPLGRSLQRSTPAPDFFAHPRIVAGVVADGSGEMLRDRLYLGFQDRAGVIEVISYNDALGRFEFQVVSNYLPGRTPVVTYARRVVCISCHQNHGPIFSQQLWLETNANPQIGAQLQRQQASFFGVPAQLTTDVSQALDDATDRSNRLALTQRLWMDGCGANASGQQCRRGALQAALQFALTGMRSYASSAEEFKRSVSVPLAANAASRWYGGLALPDPDIPNRDPLNQPPGLAQTNVDARFDPLLPRAPLEVVAASSTALPTQLVTGVAASWSDVSRDALVAAMDRRYGHAAVRRTTLPCSVTGGSGAEQFVCGAPDASLRLRGLLSRDEGSLDEVALHADEPVRHLRVGSIRRQPAKAGHSSLTFRAYRGQQSARLSDGNAIDTVTLRWQPGAAAAGNGEAVVSIREDFSHLAEIVGTLDLSPQPVRTT
ncbi:MAG TPA: hypothetical protein VIT67_23665, partial [Povalibacter sp.]